MDNDRFARTIKNARLKKGYTQSQLADLLNVSNKTISKWETGRGYPDITLLAKITSVLKLDYEELLQSNEYIIQKRKKKRKDIFTISIVCFIFAITLIGMYKVQKQQKYENNYNNIIQRLCSDYYVGDQLALAYREPASLVVMYSGGLTQKKVIQFCDYLNINDFKKIEGLNKYYPVYKETINLYGNEYTVVPYFKESSLKKDCVQMLSLENKKGIYAKLSMHDVIKQDQLEYEDFLTHQVVKMNVKGFLNNNTHCSYVKSQGSYIYMYYKNINSSNKITGYTLFFKDVESMNKAKNILKKDYIVNDSFQDGKELENIISSSKKTKMLITGALTIITFFMLFIVMNEYMNKRKIEFCLLKINGLGNKELVKMTSMEQLEIFIVNLIFIICGYILLKVFHIHFSLIDIMMICIGQILLLCLCVLTNGIKIKNMYPDRVLRF